LFTEGFDPNFGAASAEARHPEAGAGSLALKILGGEVLHGDHLIVDADKKAGKMVFTVSKRVGEKDAVKAKR